MLEGIKVRLVTELTRYHPGLLPGVEGRTVGQSGIWSRGSDRFIGVQIPSIGTFEVLWEGLEIIDADYLAQAAESKQRRMEALKTASKVLRTVGPAGGFKSLSYEYVDDKGTRHFRSIGDRTDAEELIRFFKQQGIEVNEKVLKRQR
jgi:hypothetical protein